MVIFHSFLHLAVTLFLFTGGGEAVESQNLLKSTTKDGIYPVYKAEECKSDEECLDPNSICQFTGEDDSRTSKCICNEFYKIQSNSNVLKCTRLTCSTNKDCSINGYCGATGVCWPKCISDLECMDRDTCNIESGTCYRKCSKDEDCSDSRANICDQSAGICQKECDPTDGDVCELPELCDSSGFCHLRCMKETDCKSTEYCDAVTNFCLQIKCLNDSYCGSNQFCDTDSGVCKAKSDSLK